jgi:TnpA family transposase
VPRPQREKRNARLSLTDVQRTALLTLPETEEAFVRHYSLSEDDRAAVLRCRTPETQLAFALQLCVLRYPGRILRRGEIIPFPLLAFIADQIEVAPDAIAGFARRQPTRSEHLAVSGPASASRTSRARTGHAFRRGWRRSRCAPPMVWR